MLNKQVGKQQRKKEKQNKQSKGKQTNKINKHTNNESYHYLQVAIVAILFAVSVVTFIGVKFNKKWIVVDAKKVGIYFKGILFIYIVLMSWPTHF